MTLKQWSKKTGILPTYPTTEKKAVSLISSFPYPDEENNRLHKELWHLSDYVVSSVCGIVIWLVPRNS